jgi:flagellar hook-length control protein FliK
LPRPALRADSAAGQEVAARTTSAAVSVNAVIGPPPPPPGAALASAPAPTTPVDAALPAPLNGPDFAPALGTQIAHFARNGIEHARLQLNPAEMGPIAVQLAMDGQQVRVDLVAEIAATRQALEQSLPALAGALRDAGFTLTGGGVFQHARDGNQAGDSRGAPPAPSAAALRGAEASGGVAEPARAARLQGLVDLFA